MAMKGPGRYPEASTSYWYQDTYGGNSMESNVGVIHTTEGTSVPSYGGGASAPNFTANPDFRRKRLQWYQHFDFDKSSRALVNSSGGVETNTMNAVQVELVGTCDPSTHREWDRDNREHIYWPEAPDWALREVAKFVRWAHDEHGVKMQSGLTWRSYPDSYGSNSTRLTDNEWMNFYGWCGHQHVPENHHGDPGSIDFEKILAYARGEAEEDTLSGMSDKDLADAMWRTDDVYEVSERWLAAGATNKKWYPQNALNFVGDRTLDVLDVTKATRVEVAGLTTAVQELSKALANFNDAIDPVELANTITRAVEAKMESITVELNVKE